MAKVNQNSICQSTKAVHVYLVKSTVYVNKEYEVDIEKWTCTCTVGTTGYPSGEPCKHQHSVAKKFNLTAPNLLPYFNSEGHYLHALVALGQGRAGDMSFYAGMKDLTLHPTSHGSNPNDTNTKVENDESIECQNTDMDCDEGRENLDLMVNIMEEREIEEQQKLKQDVMTLGNAFIKNV